MSRPYVPRPEHQLGIDHLLANERALLFAEMGLGKSGVTLAALRMLLLDGEITGALIVAPKRVATLSWPNEVAEWDEFKWLKIANLRTPEGWALLEAGAAHLYIINYEQLASREVVRKQKRPPTEAELLQFANGEIPFYVKLPRGLTAEDAVLSGLPPPGCYFFDEVPEYYPGVVERYFFNRRKAPAFEVVVFDESTKIKNPASKAAKAFKPYWPKIKRRWALTGTPRPEHLSDIFGQVKVIDDGKRLGPAKTNFESAYFDLSPNGYSLIERPDAYKTVMSKIADIALVLRAEDYLEITPPHIEDVEVELPSVARKAYDELEEELLAILESGAEIVGTNAGALLNKLIQIAGGAVYDDLKNAHVVHDEKVKALVKLVKEINEPVLIAYSYQHELPRILKSVPGCVAWHDKILPDWNAGKVPAIAVHPASVGHGQNLWRGGRTVIWFSRTYHRELYDQLCGRFAGARSALSGKQAQIFHIIAKDTADEAVDEALRQKHTGQKALMVFLSNLRKLRDGRS